MIKLLAEHDLVYLVTMMELPESKMKLAVLKSMKDKYKDYYPFPAYELTKLDSMIKDLKSKYESR